MAFSNQLSYRSTVQIGACDPHFCVSDHLSLANGLNVPESPSDLSDTDYHVSEYSISTPSEDDHQESTQYEPTLLNFDTFWTPNQAGHDLGTIAAGVNAAVTLPQTFATSSTPHLEEFPSRYHAGCVSATPGAAFPDLSYSTLDDGMMPLWMTEALCTDPCVYNFNLEALVPQQTFGDFNSNESTPSSPSSTEESNSSDSSTINSSRCASRKRSPLTMRRLLHMSARIRSAKVETTVNHHKLDVPFTGVLKFRVKEPPHRRAQKRQ